MRTTLDTNGVVEWLMGEIRRSDVRDIVEYHVDAIVRSVANQKDHEQVGPHEVREQLTKIAKLSKRLERLICSDDPCARAARSVMVVGQAEFNEFRRGLEDLASLRGTDDTEFIPELRPSVDEYNRDVSAAARELNKLLSEHSSPARALRRRLCASATEALSHRLQKFVRLATIRGEFMPNGLTAFFAPAEVARLGMKATSGGRPIETAKIVAVWGCYLMFVDLALEITDDPDNIFCRLSGYAYEAATGKLDADLSHAVKLIMDELSRWKPLKESKACQEKRSADTS